MEENEAESDDFAYYNGSIGIGYMDDVTRCLGALVEALKECTVYKDYEKAKMNIKDFPEIKKQIDEFRKKNFILQNSKEDKDLYQEIIIMQKEYGEFMKMPIVADYLNSELGVCRILQKINQDLMNEVDVEIDDFANEFNW